MHGGENSSLAIDFVAGSVPFVAGSIPQSDHVFPLFKGLIFDKNKNDLILLELGGISVLVTYKAHQVPIIFL
jgi:hypothetical protein